MFIFHASFMCRFQIIPQCLLIIADCSSGRLFALPSRKKSVLLDTVLIILMLIKHHHQCAWNKRTVNNNTPLFVCQGHFPLG